MNWLGLIFKYPKLFIGVCVIVVVFIIMGLCKHNGKLSAELEHVQHDNATLQHDIVANDQATLTYSLTNDEQRNAQNATMLSTVTKYQSQSKGKPHAPKHTVSTRIDDLHSGMHDVYHNANGTAGTTP